MITKEAFLPVISPDARILILGTMPGEESLVRKEYYANPRNQFWRIMQAVFDIPMSVPYADRISSLQQRQIGLWDVLHSCERDGSLDSAIKNAIPNDFTGLFATHPELKVVAFNGQKAGEWFERWVTVDISQEKLILPSTSPAAAMPFMKKVTSWSVLIEMMKS